MQMNAEFKEDQIGTPFVWVGALEGGGRGGGGKRGSSPKSTRDVQYFFFSTLLVQPTKYEQHELWFSCFWKLLEKRKECHRYHLLGENVFIFLFQ